MISKKIQKALQGSSAIRAMFVEGNELAAKVGRENVYDFSLGNPATPAPAALNEAIKECLEKQEELNVSTKTKETNRQDQRVLQGLD